ncbi:Cysteine-rich with EGF-like domain protein 2 [Aphelenchoides besseyi]|nr:Cysteine-rich with EGF-like domain protein 2 [Aphelenchoides besseyi]KAI6202317.1 Cysteine-rich with EGF-like domain protein 2 [Aphelenchoides besseyi]
MELRRILGLLRFQSLVIFVQVFGINETAKNGDSCGYCKYMVATFKQGLIKTENQHFAGGNTDWEERKLGKFKTSSKFVILGDFTSRFQCNHMAEDNEELLEKWFFKRQDTDPNIFQYVCIDKMQKCCADGHYGPSCAPCPGALKGAACFNNGKCSGDGTREGTGKCECNEGYAGVRCSTCDAHYFAVTQNDTHIQCKACFDGCASDCTSEEPTGCVACRSGYKKDDELGCVDINECENTPNLCSKSHEKCVNTQGHYNCECKDGYQRNFDTDECEIDIHAKPYDGYWRPDRMLRSIAIGGLISVAGFILFHHRSPAALISLVVASTIFVLMERWLDETTFAQDLKQMLKF